MQIIPTDTNCASRKKGAICVRDGYNFARHPQPTFQAKPRRNHDRSRDHPPACTLQVSYPYTVPLSYAYKDNKLFFHFAKEGHKVDGINRNDKVIFCVIEKDEVIPKTFTTHFRSVIVFGRTRILTEDSEKRHALECLVEKYSPDYIAEGQREIESDWNRFYAAELQIEHMTGKAAIEILKNKE